MARRLVYIGIIGAGLMGRELASAAARWCHLLDLDFEPRIVAVCDLNDKLVAWFQDNVPSVRLATANYHDLLNDSGVEAIYCAVPHNLHAKMYVDIVRAGKHLLGEKPFGIDQAANDAIMAALAENPKVHVSCSSEFPFFPGAYLLNQWIAQRRFGTIIDVEAGFWHSSDLNPDKAINWKRIVATNGAYGCMGDLGMHVCHVPFRNGWVPKSVRAQLVNIVSTRPDGKGATVPCETWDNAILSTDVEADGQRFPMTLSTKRIAPGQQNTWFVKVYGTAMSAEFTTKNPKEIRWMNYKPGDDQVWQSMDVPYKSAYPTITGGIFEFGFPDSMQQMLAAFCDELVHGRAGMKQPFHCATPHEAAASHRLFTAALESHERGVVAAV